MKAILNDKAMRQVVVDFIANPDAEFPTQSVIEKDKAGVETIVKRPHGFTQKQQALLTLILLTETVFTDYDEKQFNDALVILYAMANGSAARQTMETAGLLLKTEGGKRGADVQALASKWSKAIGAAE